MRFCEGTPGVRRQIKKKGRTMKLKKFIAISATAALLSTTALADTDPIIEQIVADLTAMGYTRIEISITANGYEVEASGQDGSVEREYDAEGALLYEEIDDDDDDEDDD